MLAQFNIFDVLNVKPVEDPHDRMVVWLCDPAGGHGISDLAYAIIDRLWDHKCTEALRKVHRPFKLADESWPDVGVEFATALLLIENKVAASALREGQIELQHELGRKRQGNAPFFHCALCPDRLATAIPEPSAIFRKLPYSVLADILASRIDLCTPEAKAILEQYIAFIRTTFGAAQPFGIKMARGETIARRNAAREPWAWEQILEQAKEHGGPNLANAHHELLDLLISMEDVEPRFLSTGSVNPTYRVYSTRGDVEHILLVYADGRINVSWQGFLRANQLEAVEAMRRVWAPYVKGPTNSNDSNTKEGLGALTPAEIATLLQETVDVTSGQPRND